jgi:predicted alpha/beta hydrolase family esterase
VTEPTERAVLVAHSAACYVALGAALVSGRIAGLICTNRATVQVLAGQDHGAPFRAPSDEPAP